MSDERSVIIFGRAYESSQRFEYFLTGMIGALCGYIGQNYTATKLGWNSSTIELASIFFLVISFALSLYRMQIVIRGLYTNAYSLHAAEGREHILSKYDGERSMIDSTTGKTFTPKQALAKAEWLARQQAGCDDAVNKTNDISIILSRFRLAFLFLGFIVLIAAKVLKAYI